MEVESVLVTGSNRGIGLEFVRQVVHLPTPPRFVFATYRNKNSIKDLQNIRDEAKDSEVILIQMDVTKLDHIKAAQEIVQSKVGIRGLNLLINNAGFAKLLGFPEVTEENLLTHFHTNTVGPFMVLQEFFPLLKKAADRGEGAKLSVSRAAVINISAGNGSITTATFDFPIIHAAVGYRVSKAASNMAMRMVAPALTKSGILDIQMCPGWVKTDMGSPAAELEVSDSIAAMLKTMKQLNESHQGTFIDRNGEPIPF
ncbi:uncharacterized protein NPIL_325331 [Nephila pilipes]|uniref:C-factor n=1 Tax=Nephila pilipes TaxID=299642 RepID=A0A8X6MUL1_NEPPI|nr:uncharacterized protein NPIL_325331 [Nephila pilipes]